MMYRRGIVLRPGKVRQAGKVAPVGIPWHAAADFPHNLFILALTPAYG